jgi:hypothetical protein
MKNFIHKILSISGAGLLLLASCKKDESKVTFNGGTAPVLTSSATDSVSLPLSDTTEIAVTFSWTNPNYTFSDGVSSQNVQYYLQFDTTSAFNSHKLQTIGFSGTLGVTYTVGQFNAIMSNGMLLSTGIPHTVQARVQSFIQSFTPGTAPVGSLSSAPVSFTVNPYALPPTVVPPKNDSLYIVGAAVAADNWANPMPPGNIPAETFTQVSPTEYTIVATLVGGGEYKLISSNGSWTDQWSVAAADTFPNGGPFVYNGANCIAPAASGNYLIDVNFQTGKFTVTPH